MIFTLSIQKNNQKKRDDFQIKKVLNREHLIKLKMKKIIGQSYNEIIKKQNQF